MIEQIIKNNQASLTGEIVSEFTFSHEVFGEGFYCTSLRINRLSSSNDTIPLMISERLIDVKKSYVGKYMEVKGQFRSYNKHETNKTRLILSVFVRELELIDSPEGRRPNAIFLDGYVCKEPVYRTTPLGREIADVLMAVNRPYGKSDYIPCICWGRNARYAGSLCVGSRVQLWGRIQSRSYQKRVDQDQMVRRTAYEVSVNKLEYVDEVSSLSLQVADPVGAL